MFWSGNTLKVRREHLVVNEDGSEAKVDCAALSLTVGNEVYITPSDPDNSKDTGVKKILTKEKPQFVIPKGQFAFLQTQEIVKVPNKALAFISFKASYKFRGLINVSGFHVDPGWNGKLTFSVYNAGPSDITIEMGDPFALIWYADLDEESSEDYRKNISIPESGLKSKLISDMAGEVFSPFKLKSELDELRKEINSLEGKIVSRYSAVVFAVFVAILGFGLRDKLFLSINEIAHHRIFNIDPQTSPAPDTTKAK
ncbi:hypothetical protein QIW46_04625 [Pseudomonas fluorescens]|uniref:dCTP deaminase domain-containing protein n=1 Tax=Pseudomonas fluorescens TaxID=294 RepID=UPI0035253200